MNKEFQIYKVSNEDRNIWMLIQTSWAWSPSHIHRVYISIIQLSSRKILLIYTRELRHGSLKCGRKSHSNSISQETSDTSPFQMGWNQELPGTWKRKIMGNEVTINEQLIILKRLEPESNLQWAKPQGGEQWLLFCWTFSNIIIALDSEFVVLRFDFGKKKSKEKNVAVSPGPPFGFVSGLRGGWGGEC